MPAAVEPLSLAAGAAAEAGLSALAATAPAVRARVEAWVTAFASDRPGVAADAYGALRKDLDALQARGYARSPDLLAAVEATLVALLGHHEDFVREAAVVDLNVLYDGHPLQRDESLPVTVASVGEELRVAVPLASKAAGAAVDDAALVSGQVVLRVFAPRPDRAGPPEWREYPLAYVEARGAVEAQLPPFACPGYYDWVVAEPGATEPAFIAMLPVDTPRRLRGRFIVQPEGVRETVLTEVPVDEAGAVWDENTGTLQTRGSFDAVRALLPSLQSEGANALYLMGALERARDEADSSPFAVVDGAMPATLLGGSGEFVSLVKEAKALGMRTIVDAFGRVSRTRMHRKYRHLTVETLNSKGIPLRHPGTDGRENQWEDTALLNFRRVETWNLMIAEIKTLAREYGVRGVRLDNAQSMPPILKANTDELFRLDSDGRPHYSLSEIFYGAVVKANEEQGYWTSDAGIERGYPNPFLVKLCREMWNEFPDFMIIAESNFHREPSLLSSGPIAHSIRIPQIIASISGKSLRRDGTVARIPQHKRSTARTLGRLFKNDRAELPKNSIIVGCNCTHLSPYPSVLFGRRAWLAVDLLYFLPQIPMLVMGEKRGRAYRMNAATVGAHEEVSQYDVNFDAVLPKSPTKRTGQTSPAEGTLPASLSLGGGLSSLARGLPSSPLPGGVLPSPVFGGGSPASGLSTLFSSASTTSSKLSKGTLATDSTPLGGLTKTGATDALATGGGRGLMRLTQMEQELHKDEKRGFLGGGASPSPLTTQTSSKGLPPTNAKPKMRRRGSLADLRRTPSSSNMVRSRSRDDMRGGSVKSVSVDEFRRMSAVEEDIRRELDPGSGFDITQIHAHYSHRLFLRQQIRALQVGLMSPLRVDAHLGDFVFAFARFTDEEIVIVVTNFADPKENPDRSDGFGVDLDLRQLWDFLPESYTKGESVHDFYTVTDAITGDTHSDELATLEEIAFRRYHVTMRPLSLALLKISKVDATEEMRRKHFTNCVQRLSSSDDGGDMKDPRENSAVASVARGAALSVAAFAKALLDIRSVMLADGVDDEAVLRTLQLCVQRASQLLFLVSYEGVPGPKDFEPPVAERMVAYLTHMSTAGRDEDMLKLARALVARTTKLGPLVFLSAELGRFSTAGGLGVMVDELTKGLVGLGLEVYVISPYYTVNRKNQTGYLGPGINWTRNVTVNLGTHMVEVGVFQGKEEGVNLIFLERGDYFPKVYADTGGAEKHMQTCVLASLGSLEVCCQLGLVPSVVVSNDWLMAMCSGYRNFFGSFFENTTFYHLIHNFGGGSYEGRCYPDVNKQGALEHVHRLSRHLVMNDSWNQKVCNPSRTALMTTDNWGTVSPSYLKELLASHPLGDLLHMAKSPFGYPNGIRKAEREQALREHGAATHEEAKELLQKRYFGFEKGDPSIPLFSFVGRITSQKGVHMILNAVEELIGFTGGKIQILVGGPADHSDAYSAGCARHALDLRRRFPWSFWADPDGFFTDGPLVNLGSDFGVMPSLFEPGGIVQQEFFVAGTPVIAFRTGGLKDTVHEWSKDEMEGNGFTFDGYHHGDFVWALKRALRVYSSHEEYAHLRESAYETTIDVTQVAWAWACEFHRMRNACFTRANVVCAAINVSSSEEADIFDPKSRLVTIQWNGAGKHVVLKGSFDGWAAEWNLASEGEMLKALVKGDGLPHQSLDNDDSQSGVKALTLRLRPGTYGYKFKVDGEWTIAEDQAKRDEGGIVNNSITVE